jgi:hypothetical protein
MKCFYKWNNISEIKRVYYLLFSNIKNSLICVNNYFFEQIVKIIINLLVKKTNFVPTKKKTN